ncbi:hypothetical protein QFC21_000516 [Naganishia friedmannii]|uniref:Uncharacterized protein n=1 Tax=Naganishia friedmannii TaxID=89922 RepID=A0ACC2WF66_9TREE|nr:hypothetical protein QFC21_000516 [Naganishia friedmannii]
MADDNSYEQERQRIIAENAALLAQLGLDHFSASSPAGGRSRGSSVAGGANGGGGSSTASKRKPRASAGAREGSKRSKLSNGADGEDGSAAAASAARGGGMSTSTRRSTRLMGLVPESEEAVAHLAAQAERAKKELEALRHAERKVRKEVEALGELVREEEWNEDNDRNGQELTSFLASVASKPNPRPTSSLAYTSTDPYTDATSTTAAETALRNTYRTSTFLRTAKMNTERVYSLTVHPDPTRVLVFSGDKRGIVGVWDANARDHDGDADDDDEGEAQDDKRGRLSVKREDEDAGDGEAIVKDWTRGSGKVWRMQVHQRSAISCLKVDPTRGDTLFTSAYDCSIRALSLTNGISTSIYALPDPDALINHFDISPSGHEIWAVDSLGGLSHVDMREDNGNGKAWARRRWVISAQSRNTKIGGVSINRESRFLELVNMFWIVADCHGRAAMNPSLICTASNDRTMRIWDTRHLHSIRSHPFTPAQIPEVDSKEPASDPDKLRLDHTGHSPSLYPTVLSEWDEDVYPAMNTKKHAGLLRAESAHEKSCSAAYWDPAGRRVLTTCYDDRIRVYDAKPSLFKVDVPVEGTFNPHLKVKHNCQTGRYVTIFKAQWCQNTQLAPHFSIGNMKKRVSVFSGLTGSLIADLSHPSLTAVPAVTATHPNIAGVVVGGNASGKCHLWGPAPLLD